MSRSSALNRMKEAMRPDYSEVNVSLLTWRNKPTATAGLAVTAGVQKHVHVIFSHVRIDTDGFNTSVIMCYSPELQRIHLRRPPIQSGCEILLESRQVQRAIPSIFTFAYVTRAAFDSFIALRSSPAASALPSSPLQPLPPIPFHIHTFLP